MKLRIVATLLALFLAGSALAETTTFEGVVKSVDPDEMRVVIVTSSDEIVAALGSDDTPVRFEGSQYRIRNLEVGDLVRMVVESEGENHRVESIDVLSSVAPAERLTPRPEPEPEPEMEPAPVSSAGTTLTSVYGKVDQTRPDRNLIRIIADGGLSWVRVDATNARTPDGTPFKVSDLTFGESIEAVGEIGSNGELIATVIRRESDLSGGTPAPVMIDVDEPDTPAPPAGSVYTPREIKWLDVVEFAGEIVSPLDRGQTLTIRNAVTNADEVVWCDPAFVTLYDDEPLAASDLEAGMKVEVRALRVSEGLVVQSIEVEEED